MMEFTAVKCHNSFLNIRENIEAQCAIIRRLAVGGEVGLIFTIRPQSDLTCGL
jgi:hypothetical protein